MSTCRSDDVVLVEDRGPSTKAPDPAAVEVTPIDAFLSEQGNLTAVEQFERRHDGDLLTTHSRYYRDLVPLSAPGPGQQYAFEVDLDACTGCKACVVACHNINGLDEGESFRATGLLHGGTPVLPLQQTVTTACHHCVDPACMNGCPTRAFDKDPVTGIVFHTEERCLGCGYCTWTCPYEVPRFNEARGVVRKCDMCRTRLSAGEAPACVEACPNGAIAIRLVDVATARASAGEPGAAVLPTAPPSRLTVPTTRYATAWEIPPDVVSADYRTVRPGHGHRPLVAMLVLTQVAVGTLGVGLLAPGRPTAPAALALALAGMAASVAHLGQPQRLWRSLAGLRRSWLSREVATLGAFTALAAVAALTSGVIVTALGSVVGVAAVASSAMLYVVTRRPWWQARLTVPRFAVTTVAGGLATVLALGGPRSLGWALALVVGVALLVQAMVTARHLRAGDLTHLRRSALLLVGPLRTVTAWRVGLGILGGVLLPVLVAAGIGPTGAVAAAAWALLLAGEVAERLLFFRAAAWTAMPGVLD